MKELTLKRVRCTNFSGTNPQEFRIEFRVDANDVREPYYAAGTVETAGDSVSLGRAYGIDEDFGFALLDGAQSDGVRLDTAVITDPAPNTGSVTLQGDGQTYEIDYELGGLNGDKLEHAVTDFENSSESGVWPNLASKSTLTERIRNLTETSQNASDSGAFAFDQDGALLCAPSAIAFALAHFEPRRFVEVCRSFYELGGMLTRTGGLEVNSTLRRRKVKESQLKESVVQGRGPIHPLDWMVAASFANISDADSTKMSASSGQMLNWTAEIIGYENTQTLSVGQEYLSLLQSAQQVLNQGGVVFFGIPLSALDGLGWWQTWVDPPPENHIITLVEIKSLPNSSSGDTEWVVQQQGNKQHVSGPVSDLGEVVYSAMAGSP